MYIDRNTLAQEFKTKENKQIKTKKKRERNNQMTSDVLSSVIVCAICPSKYLYLREIAQFEHLNE